MRDLGFTIGSHTVTHIDCAKEAEVLVWKELLESLDVLRRELGQDRTIFAYPYGKRINMTPERLELVKKAGYIACLSAYGGLNKRKVDPFDVRRQGIHWEFSDIAFLARCYGFSRPHQ
jgi:peptidoglycan/xylan/chitin deacetylase (PgdA/CDA1 family)